MTNRNNNNSNSSSSDDEAEGDQIRVALTLSSEVTDRSLEVPTEPIAVPATIGRKGLAAVINHLLDRNVVAEDSDDNDDDDDQDENVDKLPALPFDFVLKDNNRMLRTGVEREARRHGLSLEKPLSIVYFPAQEAPELQGESEALPDWISCLEYTTTTTTNNNSNQSAPDDAYLCAAAYDGSLRLYQPTMEHHDEGESVVLNPIASTSKAHTGPIKCLSTMMDTTSSNNNQTLWIASGSMDQSLVVHTMDVQSKTLHKECKCQYGHAAAIGAVDWFPHTKTLASGDWDGTLCLWDLILNDDSAQYDDGHRHATKKVKTGEKSSRKKASHSIKPKVLLPQAHTSQISGCSWGNFRKHNASTGATHNNNTLITGSWDHSVKTWDIERQECVLSLNGSRVVACLDTSHHSDGIVATGHPDCAIRLWDVRTSSSSNGENSASVVSDKTFRPSHKAWVSAVQWSPSNPYHLASTSHDGTVKVWDIRSSIPLHTVRVFPKSEKGLCMAYGKHITRDEEGSDASASIFLGGTDCIVKQFTTNG